MIDFWYAWVARSPLRHKFIIYLLQINLLFQIILHLIRFKLWYPGEHVSISAVSTQVLPERNSDYVFFYYFFFICSFMIQFSLVQFNSIIYLLQCHSDLFRNNVQSQALCKQHTFNGRHCLLLGLRTRLQILTALDGKLHKNAISFHPPNVCGFLDEDLVGIET